MVMEYSDEAADVNASNSQQSTDTQVRILEALSDFSFKVFLPGFSCLPNSMVIRSSFFSKNGR